MNIKRLASRVVIAVIFVIFILGLAFADRLSGFAMDNLISLQSSLTDNFYTFLCLFILIYALLVVLALPGGALMSLLSGYFFGLVPGFFAVMIGASGGALATWALINSAGISFDRGFMGRLYDRFRNYIAVAPFQSLLLLRLIPVLPFYLMNVIAATSGVRLKTFTVTLVLGLIPSTLAFVSIGQQVGIQIASRSLSLANLMSDPMITIPLLILILPLLLAMYINIKGRLS